MPLCMHVTLVQRHSSDQSCAPARELGRPASVRHGKYGSFPTTILTSTDAIFILSFPANMCTSAASALPAASMMPRLGLTGCS